MHSDSARCRAHQHKSTELLHRQPPPYLSNHGAAIVDELGQHHRHVVVDGGGVVGPLS